MGEANGAGAETAAESRERRPGGVGIADPRHRYGQSETSTEESTAQAVEQQDLAERGAVRQAELPQGDLQVVADKSVQAEPSGQVQLLGAERTRRQRGEPPGGTHSESAREREREISGRVRGPHVFSIARFDRCVNLGLRAGELVLSFSASGRRGGGTHDDGDGKVPQCQHVGSPKAESVGGNDADNRRR